MLSANPGLESLILWHAQLPAFQVPKSGAPFFPSKNGFAGVGPDSVCQYGACVWFHHSCMALVSSSNFIDNCISNLEEKVLNDDLSLRAAGPGCELGCVPASKNFAGLCPAICAFLAPLWELKAGAESGTQNCASESKNLALRTPFLAAIFDPLSGAGKIEKSRAETRAKFWLHIEVRHTELRAQLLPTGRRNFLLYVIVASYTNLISAGCQRQYLLGRQHGKFPVALCVPIWCVRLIPS